MKKIIRLTDSAYKVINEYINLPIGGKNIRCPYYINTKRERMGLRVLIGKGDPGEIVKEVKVCAKLKDFDLLKANSDQIRKFMIDRSIGIECSGFVVHVLGYMLKLEKKIRLWDIIKYDNNSIFSILRRKLRPVESLGANTLTNLNNCIPIKKINDIRPGDFIRSKGLIKNSHHILLITSITIEDNNVKEIEYAHSRAHYEDKNGVYISKIIIKNIKETLEKQDWQEVYKGINWTLRGYNNQLSDNGIRRLKNIEIPNIEVLN